MYLVLVCFGKIGENVLNSAVLRVFNRPEHPVTVGHTTGDDSGGDSPERVGDAVIGGGG